MRWRRLPGRSARLWSKIWRSRSTAIGLTDVAPERLPDLFAGRATTIAFRADTGSTARLTGRRADGSRVLAGGPGKRPRPAGYRAPLGPASSQRSRGPVSARHGRQGGDRGRDRRALHVTRRALALHRLRGGRRSAGRSLASDRRTIVQPVEMPHLWASQPPLAASLSMIDTAGFLMARARVIDSRVSAPASGDRASGFLGRAESSGPSHAGRAPGARHCRSDAAVAGRPA